MSAFAILCGLALTAVCTTALHLPQSTDTAALVSSRATILRSNPTPLDRWRRTAEVQTEPKKNKKKNSDKKKPVDGGGYNFVNDCLAAHNKWRQLHGAADLKWDTKVS